MIDETPHRSTLVAGGGIAGIEAALNLADLGVRVYLIEQEPTIGGHLLQLDKICPTDHCSFCLIWPLMLRCRDHPGITLIKDAKVHQIDGQAGDFLVTVLKGPVYVLPERCTGCGECARVCPVDIGHRKAIFRPSDHAVPDSYILDPENCTQCGRCADHCPFGAIDLEADSRKEVIRVEAVVLATGFEPYDPTPLEEYAYGLSPDIMTSLEFEAWISDTGVRRPSDGSPPRSIAFIQCVGSRDKRAHPYCSGFCCMHAVKEAIWACERAPNLEGYIFYTDMRAFGRECQYYVAESQKTGRIKYIRSRPGRVMPKDGQLEVRFEDTTTREMKILHADMVVLSTAIIPFRGFELKGSNRRSHSDESGFIRVPNGSGQTLQTGYPGIFTCGCCHGPSDAVESAVQATAAAAQAMDRLGKREGR